MFKIASAEFSESVNRASHQDAVDHQILQQFCISEAWTGDLSNGLFRLGEQATRLHGMADGECGLLNLVRCYNGIDRTHVVALFEQAATTSSSFCYTTMVVLPSGAKQPIFCIGESCGLETHYSGTMRGMFFFPRFQVETRTRFMTQ